MFAGKPLPSVFALLVRAAAAAALAAAACGPAPSGHARLEADLAQSLEDLRQEYGFPGATAAVALPDGAVITVASGFADVEAQIPMHPDHRMLSGSIGKTFASALAIKLAVEGKLDLDDKIERWFGDRAWFSRLPNGHDITVRMLLNHSSGLENHAWYAQVTEAVGETFKDGVDYRPSHEDLVKMILDKKPLFPAGDGFYYSDTDYILVGWIIEMITGEDYYAALKREILDPLGLDDTTAQVGRDFPGLAAGYMGADNEFGYPDKIADIGRLYYDPTFEWTGGGIVTASADLARWGRALYIAHAFGPEHFKELLNAGDGRAPITDIPSLGPYRYGLGVYIHDSPLGTMIGHGGVMFGYTSRLRCVVEGGYCIAVQTNKNFDSYTHDYILALGAVVASYLKANP